MLIAELPIIDISFPRLLMMAGIATLVALVLCTLFVVKTNRRAEDRKGRGWLSRAIYGVFIAMIGVLAISSFGSVLLFGHLAGYALLAHLAAGGSFVFLLLAIAGLYLPLNASSGDGFLTADHRWWVARWSALLLVLSSLVAAGTMFLSMLPILDTEGLVEVATLHSYCGLVVVIAAIFHAFALLCTRLGWR
jgi:hypothetical protein